MTPAALPALRFLAAAIAAAPPAPSVGGWRGTGPLLSPAAVDAARTVDVVNMHPDPNALALVGLVIGAAAWALGSHGQNYQQSFVGRRAVLISGLAALLIGAGPGLVNFFFNAGSGVH
jgi:hypothetical protein